VPTADSNTETNEQPLKLASPNRLWAVAGIVVIFASGLVSVGALRYLDLRSANPPAIAAYATVTYVGLTVLTAIFLIRVGVPLRRLGFFLTVRPWFIVALVLPGVALLQLSGWLLTPVWEYVFGSGRDLTRFSDVAGSLGALLGLLALSWTLAAFGEEIAFRIVLMRGIAYALGDSRAAWYTAGSRWRPAAASGRPPSPTGSTIRSASSASMARSQQDLNALTRSRRPRRTS